jgi:hypothetical protein
MGYANTTFTDTRKVVLSLTSPLPPLYANTQFFNHSCVFRPDQPPVHANLPRPETRDT